VLLSYRKHCASATSAGQVSCLPFLELQDERESLQLILPESFKLYPLYAMSVMKTKALKGANGSCCLMAAVNDVCTGGPVASDVRTYYMRMIKSFGVFASIELLYPRFFPLHNLLPEDCQRLQDGRFQFPPQLRLSYQRMESHGAYLVGAWRRRNSCHTLTQSRIENGETAILWLGSSVSPALLQDLYGVDDLKDIDTRMVGRAQAYSLAGGR
jgi:protein transport protein SEC24